MNYIYEVPTKLVIGKDCIQKQGNLFASLGTKACIVTGKSSAKRNGSYQDVIAALEAIDIEHVLFDEVEENPSLETLEKAKNLALEAKADFVIGIGGGSPMDAAKGIAVMIKNPHIGANNLICDTILNGVPVVAIPTTAGTGSEVTPYAIFTDHKLGTKVNYGHRVFPTLAFLDATYILDMPISLTRYTALDALSHLIESYLNVKTNPISEIYVKEGLTLWAKGIEPLLSGSLNLQDREHLLLASTYAGMAIAQTGTSLPHTMGYSLTYYEGLHHGVANTMLYRAYLGCFKDKGPINTLVKWLNLNNIEELYTIIDRLLIDISLACADEVLQKYTDVVFGNKAKIANHPEEVSKELLFGIFKDSVGNKN